VIDELRRVVLTTDLPERHLQAGNIGTVVMVHHQGQGYTAEFVTLGGDTVAVVTVPAAHVRVVRDDEIAHARLLTPAA
jgi:hypothetical protein